MTADDDAVRLYLALGRLHRAVRRDAPEGTLGHGALSALATVVHHGPIRPGTLAAQEGVRAPSMTRIVAFLEQQGYVARTADPDDGRAQLVEATQEGVELVSEGRGQRLRALGARLSRLSAADRNRLLAALPALEELGLEEPGAG